MVAILSKLLLLLFLAENTTISKHQTRTVFGINYLTIQLLFLLWLKPAPDVHFQPLKRQINTSFTNGMVHFIYYAVYLLFFYI